MTFNDTFAGVRAASRQLLEISADGRSRAITALASLVEENIDSILEANARDLSRMDPSNPLYDRLQLTPDRLRAIAADLRHVAALPTPVGEEVEHRTLPNGIDLRRVRVPFGVVGVIYEARPNVTYDVFSLCLRSGNACILKGGRDAEESNLAAIGLIRRALESAGLPADACVLLPSTHEATAALLSSVGYVDVCIPRGGRKLIDFVRDNARVPVIETGAGVVHAYFDSMGDVAMGAAIVGNAKTLEMVRGFYGIEDNVMKIADGDTLDLGGLTLKFILTPMVHWPETMMTWVAERAVLFTGDAFGCFGALNGAVIDRDMDTAPYYPEMYRYYSNIVGKYGMFVQKAFAKISALKVSFICPTHGPVWHDEIDRVGSVYDRLSRYEGEVGVTVVYGSMYGNTAEMAEAIAARLAERGIRNIRVHDASVSHLSYILSDIFRFKGLIVGAPTYSNTLFPPVEAVMNAIKTRDLKNRVTGVFGSFCWAPQAVKRISQYFGECNLCSDEIVSVEAKQAPGADDLARCRQLADAVADRLLQV